MATKRMSRHEVAAINVACRGMKILGGEMLLRQGSVGDPHCLSSDFRLGAQNHGGNT
jgi:hypothetical protein